MYCRYFIVDLEYSARLKNIEDTEKAKRQVAEERKERKRPADDEEHLAAARCESLNFVIFVLVLKGFP